MFITLSSHRRAVLQALFVTFLWSTSWVLIKIGLGNIPALTFAGLRYSLASLCLLPVALGASSRTPLPPLTRRDWGQLLLLGVLYHAVTAGAQFVGLAYLPAVTVSLLLNFTTVVVALLGIAWLGERPTALQWGGMALALGGALVYFYPVAFPTSQVFGLVVVVVGVLANAVSAVLGRQVNRAAHLPPLVVTVISMSVGAVLLLGAGVVSQGLPPLGPAQWAIIGWLAVVNTAFAFTLWNHTLRQLSAVESSLINSSMLVQIAVLAWLFLAEPLSARQLLGLALVVGGIIVVQRK